MTNVKKIFGGIFTMAALLLFTQCENKETQTVSETVKFNDTIPCRLPIAYVDQDSLLYHFDLYNSMQRSLENKYNKYQNSLSSEAKKFQDEVNLFQQKLQNNAFLTQDRFSQEETRLQRMQQDLEKKNYQIQQDMALEYKVMEMQLADSVRLGMKEYNNPQKYQLILAKHSGLLVFYADDQYDITNEVIEFFNKRFKVEK
ncbi:outer membrane protein [Dysgonomonadaceae bacterium PH5-43]|nr:outer membrane protein [Dysgonomonadaceae bacterium PH5-43]